LQDSIPKTIQSRLRQYAGEPVSNSRHAACVAIGNKVLTVGRNSSKTHPRVAELTGDPEKCCLHAEMDAIFKAEKIIRSFKRCSLYVVRVSNISDDFLYSKPCEYCQKLISRYPFKKVVYSNEK
jgi:deoxycytidylate deaminase